jgi:hypothetical protein
MLKVKVKQILNYYIKLEIMRVQVKFVIIARNNQILSLLLTLILVFSKENPSKMNIKLTWDNKT